MTNTEMAERAKVFLEKKIGELSGVPIIGTAQDGDNHPVLLGDVAATRTGLAKAWAVLVPGRPDAEPEFLWPKDSG